MSGSIWVTLPAPHLQTSPIEIVVMLYYYVGMGALVNIGWSRLDRWVDESGDGGVMNEICSRVAEGDSLKGIARSVGMPYSVIWNYLQEGDRMELYRQAKEAAAESLADEVLEVADTSEVVRDRVDARKWLASKWGKRTYGDKQDGDAKVGITVIVQRDGVSYGTG